MSLSVGCDTCLCSLSLWERTGVRVPSVSLKPLTLTLSRWGEGTEGTSQNQRDSVLEPCFYRNVAPLLRQPVLRLGYCGTPFIGAVSGFLG